jgi:hypothetical protein
MLAIQAEKVIPAVPAALEDLRAITRTWQEKPQSPSLFDLTASVINWV